MSVAPQLRSLEIDIPSKPDALVKLSLLLAEDDVNQRAVAALVEADMALAAAVMKAVNSSLYGLAGRVQSVQQAITYLGTREVAGITFEMGLRAAFPPAAELEPLWQRAAERGLWVGRLAQRMVSQPFGLAHWGLSFPLAALTALTLQLGQTGPMAGLGVALLALTSVVIAGLALATVHGLRSGSLLQAEAVPISVASASD